MESLQIHSKLKDNSLVLQNKLLLYFKALLSMNYHLYILAYRSFSQTVTKLNFQSTNITLFNL